MINAIKNKNDKLVNKILKRLNNIENKAKLIYDFYIGFISNPNEVIQLIAQKTDFDTDGELSFLKFQLYLNKVSELTNSLTPNNLEIIPDKQNDFINFVTYFNILCTEKMHKEPQVSINFVRKFKITNKKHN